MCEILEFLKSNHSRDYEFLQNLTKGLLQIAYEVYHRGSCVKGLVSVYSADGK